ncbi:MAG: DegT/DnrJ/EryC1/StrS family aminotransferase [Desulfohalobiaceae bacterium]
MQVPFVDLKRQYTPLMDQIQASVAQAIASCQFIGGQDLEQFCQELSSWWGVQGVVGVSSATLGLYAALKSKGIGPGDEVLTTVHTAIPTSEAISMTGARVVFCDIDPRTYNLDPGQAELRITPRSRAIIPVHLYGQPADMFRIMDLAREHELYVLEDCAQAQGARYQGQLVGTIGDAAVLSFFPSKSLGGIGDGGAVTAKDPELLQKIRMFCNHGRKQKYWHEFEGTNSRLDNIKAAMLKVTLPWLEHWNSQRRQAAQWYLQELQQVQEIVLPACNEDCEHVYHLFVILARERDQLAEHLSQRGIRSGLHYPYALNQLPAYAYLNQGTGCFPVAEDVCARVLSLPMFPGITREEVQEVCRAIKDFYRTQA